MGSMSWPALAVVAGYYDMGSPMDMQSHGGVVFFGVCNSFSWTTQCHSG